MKQIFAGICAMLLVCTSCKKDIFPGYDSSVLAPLSVEFDNIAGQKNLQLNGPAYVNAFGEMFTPSKLKYFVSNFIVTRTDNSKYIVPPDSCYFLVDESEEDSQEPIIMIPEGEYKTIQFLLGIDSLKASQSLSLRSGSLDPALHPDMYWNNSDGYIFFNLEGKYSSTSQAGDFRYHIGGNRAINNLKTITLDLEARGVPKVKDGKETNIHLMVDLEKLFSSQEIISIGSHSSVDLTDFSAVLSANFAGMFHHDHTEN